jgi:MFS transporter, FHS family, Na+ dependent glucose transporter 1
MSTANAPTTSQNTTPISLPRGTRTALYYAIILLIGIIAAILGPSLPAFSASTRTQLGLLGSLFTVRSLGGLIGSPLAGRLLDRIPGHFVLAGTLVCLALSLATIPLLSILWVLWIFVFLWGMGESFLDVSVNTLLIWTHGSKVAPFMNGLHFFFGVGALIAPILYVRSITLTGQMNLAYWLTAAIMLPTAIWALFLRSPSSPVLTPQTQGESRFNLPIFIICVLFFLYVGAEVSFGGWVYTYALNSGLADVTTAGYLNSAFWGMLTLGRLLAIPASLLIRPSRLIAIALAGCLLSLAILWLTPAGIVTLWIGTLGLGFSMAPIFPTLLAVAGRRLQLTGQVTSWFFIASNAGGMTLPWLVGIIFERVSPTAMMPVLFFDLTLAIVLFLWLVIKLPPKPLPPIVVVSEARHG